MVAAIHYHPEAYTISGPKLMGRNAAGASFLRGFCCYSQTTAFWAFVQRPEYAQGFARAVHAAGRLEPVMVVDPPHIGVLAQPGTLYTPGPGLGEQAWQRSTFGHGAWSLCGVTHTTASARAMDALADLLTAPVQPWDALICTSKAVRDNVQRILQAQIEYLVQRLGARRFILPQLPVIPLGIHTQDFNFTPAQRAVARAAVGADDRTLVVLFEGRLSFHAKAHPLAMYQALEYAAQTLSGQRVLLVECGWHANESIAAAYAEAASAACPTVRVLTLDGRKAQARQTAWACADIFCSLSDNIQETFGLVPIEAMAAGLPVVVSDWDGYKDTVRDGVDGIRIPTFMPGTGMGKDLALRHALGIDTYDLYCGYTCAFVAVDVRAIAQAFIRLLNDPQLRKQMGEAGRKRSQIYDWAVIIPQYEALWEKLSDMRKCHASSKPLPTNPWPARLDPFYTFSAYATQQLTLMTIFCLVNDYRVSKIRLECYSKLKMVKFASQVMPMDVEFLAVLGRLAAGPQTAKSLIAEFSPERRSYVFRGLTWLLKLGIVTVK